jgi:hypothetical protein
MFCGAPFTTSFFSKNQVQIFMYDQKKLNQGLFTLINKTLQKAVVVCPAGIGIGRISD